VTRKCATSSPGGAVVLILLRLAKLVAGDDLGVIIEAKGLVTDRLEECLCIGLKAGRLSAAAVTGCPIAWCGHLGHPEGCRERGEHRKEDALQAKHSQRLGEQ
jgi:hypothetical protein